MGNPGVALVTGASRGAGKGIALALAEKGMTVYVTGRSTETGSAFYVDRYGDDAEKWFTIRRKDADEGIRHTLRRIKALAEDRP